MSCIFSTLVRLGPQGLTMELPGDSQDHFFKILARVEPSFSMSFEVFGEISWPEFPKKITGVIQDFC